MTDLGPSSWACLLMAALRHPLCPMVADVHSRGRGIRIRNRPTTMSISNAYRFSDARRLRLTGTDCKIAPCLVLPYAHSHDWVEMIPLPVSDLP